MMDKVIKLLQAHEKKQQAKEERMVRDITRALEAARRDLLNQLAVGYAGLGQEITSARVRTLVDQAALVRGIERELAALRGVMQGVMSEGLGEVVEEATAAILEELAVLAEQAGVPFFPFAVDGVAQLTIATAVEQIEGWGTAIQSQLISELRQGLASGERFSELAGRMYAAKVTDGQASIWRRGMTSAELMSRRAVIQADNNSRLIFMQEGKSQLPTLKKQVVAATSSRTTQTCLRAHGQIKELDEPFELSGEPKFGRRMMAPPFHWNCRTAVVGYLPTADNVRDTADMRREARAELAGRNR